jgi:hypothetical protein
VLSSRSRVKVFYFFMAKAVMSVWGRSPRNRITKRSISRVGTRLRCGRSYLGEVLTEVGNELIARLLRGCPISKHLELCLGELFTALFLNVDNLKSRMRFSVGYGATKIKELIK